LSNWISRTPSGLFGQVPLFLSEPNIALEQRTVNFRVPYSSVWPLQAVNHLEAQHGGPIRIFGECAQFLWAQGKLDAAIQLEKLANELVKTYSVDVLGGYF
jgi:hypothetical protein